MIRTMVAALAAALLIAPPALAEPIVQSIETHDNSKGELDRRGDGFVHRNTGYVFPLQLASLPGLKTVTYGPGNASVSYREQTPGSYMLVTIYVYPVRMTLADEIASVEESLLAAMPGGAVPPPLGVPAPPKNANERWFHSRFNDSDVLTGYRIVRSGGSYIKVRMTMPRATDQTTRERGWAALAAVRWNLPV